MVRARAALAVLLAVIVVAGAAVYLTSLYKPGRGPSSTTVTRPTTTYTAGVSGSAVRTAVAGGVHSASSTGMYPVLRIALGDWGFPSPFRFYPRGPGYVVTSFIFDTLVWKNATGVIPWLAVSWESRDGGRVWIFHLRRGVRWQDGVPLTARDVVFSIEYYLRHGWQWKNIDPRLVKEVRALDNYTVEIVLSRPMPLFLEEYASTLFIIPEHIWRNVTNPYTYTSRKAVIGSGPYMLVEYKPGWGYVLKANPYWWLGRPKFRKLVIVGGFTNPRALAAALAEGRVDTGVFMGMAYRVVKHLLERHPGLRVQKGPMYFVVFLGFNLRKWPYSSRLFRVAVAHAINDTELILESMGSLEAAVPGSPGYIPPYSRFYNPDIPRYPYNPRLSEKLLDELGLRDVNGDGCRELPGGKPFHPLLVTTTSFARDAMIVARMLRRVGICVTVKTVESWKQLDAIARSGRFDMVIMGHGAVGNDPLAFTWYFSGRFGLPWRNETYEKLVERLLSANTTREVYRIARELQEVIAWNLPRIPLYYPNIFVVTRPGVPVHWFFTYGGIDGGIPLPYNKLALIEVNETR